MERLERQQLAARTKTRQYVGVTSESLFYTQMVSAKVLEVAPTFTDRLMALASVPLPFELEQPFPAPSSGEAAVTKPYVLRQLVKLRDSGGERGPGPRLTTRPEPIAPRFTARKPDFVCYKENCSGGLGIVWLGKVATLIVTDFSNADKGQICEMGRELLMNVQLNRPHVICVLTDGETFQFFDVVRSSDASDIVGFRIEESEVTQGCPGWQVGLSNGMYTVRTK